MNIQYNKCFLKHALLRRTCFDNLSQQTTQILRSHLFKLCVLPLITTASPSLDRAGGLLVIGNYSWRARNPSKVFPSRGRYPASLRPFRNFLWLCCGVWQQRWHHFLQRQIQRACLQVKLEWHWCEITYYEGTLLNFISILVVSHDFFIYSSRPFNWSESRSNWCNGLRLDLQGLVLDLQHLPISSGLQSHRWIQARHRNRIRSAERDCNSSRYRVSTKFGLINKKKRYFCLTVSMCKALPGSYGCNLALYE